MTPPAVGQALRSARSPAQQSGSRMKEETRPGSMRCQRVVRIWRQRIGRSPPQRHEAKLGQPGPVLKDRFHFRDTPRKPGVQPSRGSLQLSRAEASVYTPRGVAPAPRKACATPSCALPARLRLRDRARRHFQRRRRRQSAVSVQAARRGDPRAAGSFCPGQPWRHSAGRGENGQQRGCREGKQCKARSSGPRCTNSRRSRLGASNGKCGDRAGKVNGTCFAASRGAPCSARTNDCARKAHKD